MTTCAQYKKVTVITDPNNPEIDLVNKAMDYGKVIAKEECSDGFVFLIRIPSALESDVPHEIV